jgi:hypothetical protein
MSAQIPDALLQRVPPELRNRQCICRKCVESFHQETMPAERSPLPTEDYYYDRNLMVFTATYLLRRGYCCQSGCRHCPYPHVQ